MTTKHVTGGRQPFRNPQWPGQPPPHDAGAREFYADEMKARVRWVGIGLVFLGFLLAFCASHASDYTRDGGTADFMCCTDKACTTVISQHADAVRARDACGKLTDADGKIRWTRSNAFRITKPGTTTPPPTCPPKPADETQTVQCAAPTTGSWQQTRAYVSAAAPTCWTAGPWTPATAPSGACVTPPVPTAAALVYSPTAGGTYFALNGATVSGSINVRFGADCATAPPGPWRYFVDDVAKNTEQECPFGLIDDTALFDTKTLSNGAHTVKVTGSSTVTATFTVANTVQPPPPVGTGSSTLSWTPPTQNTDGSALTNLAGYRIAYGTSATALNQTLQVATPSLSSYVVTGLASGTWYFAVRAYNSAGAESDSSGVASKAVP